MATPKDSRGVPVAAAAPPGCAACWICLEDEADDTGEPLVRDCACRRSAAGYHVSCIISYASRKCVEAIRKYDQGKAVNINEFLDNWVECPNCNQSYEGTLKHRLAEALVGATAELPDSHHLRFAALQELACIRMKMGEAEQDTSMNDFLYLLTVLKTESSAIASKWGVENALEREIKILQDIGDLYVMREEHYKALESYEQAVERLNDFPRTKYYEIIREHLSGRVTRIKVEMGQEEETDEEVHWRRQVQRAIELNNGQEDTKQVYEAKLALAYDLLSKDQPCFLEALKLLKEIVEGLRRLLGPEHRETAFAEEFLNSAKNAYRMSLKSG